MKDDIRIAEYWLAILFCPVPQTLRLAPTSLEAGAAESGAGR